MDTRDYGFYATYPKYGTALCESLSLCMSIVVFVWRTNLFVWYKSYDMVPYDIFTVPWKSNLTVDLFKNLVLFVHK